MFTCNRIAIFFGALIACSSCVSGFFWGSSDSSQENRPLQPYPITTYYQRVVPGASPNYIQGNGDPQGVPVQIPAIPIQVPLRASFSPNDNIHNVQLVPCLCPVNPEIDFNRPPEGNSAFVNHIKNPEN